jgi:ATP-binding cassette, subfamily B, bacterial
MTEREYAKYEIQGELMGAAERALSALPVVQAFGQEEFEETRFRAVGFRAALATVRSTAAQLQYQAATGGVLGLSTAAVILVGGIQAVDGHLTPGGLVVVLSYLVALQAPLQSLASTSSGVATAKAKADRVFEVLDAQDVVRDKPWAIELPRGAVSGRVSISNVTFGYEPGRPVLHDINLDVAPGEMVALVGSTGAGKSTLVSLIPRFFDPEKGSVTIDGVDVVDATLESVRSQVALVLQEPFLLPLSAADNIAYGRPGATQEMIVEAAVAANADEFIRRLPQGYDTPLGERGASLSGGERQRLSIARALIKRAPILILDEPTAALDARTEALLLEAIEHLVAGRTTLLIAHRLSTVRRANRIVVLDHGRIIEEGTHEDLLTKNGAYQKAYTLQFGPAKASGQPPLALKIGHEDPGPDWLIRRDHRGA